MLQLFVLLTALSLGNQDDVLITAEGRSLPGKLVSIEGNQLQWRGESGVQEFSFDSLEQIRRIDREAIETPTNLPIVRLVDTCVLRPKTIRLSDAQFNAASDEMGFELERSQVAVMQFPTVDDDEKLASQWRKLLQEEAAGDVVVLRKMEEAVDGTQTTVLVNYEGVVLSIDDENVQFRFGETIVPVARSRVYGIRLYQATPGDYAEPRCLVQLIDGSSLFARELSMVDQTVSLQTPAGVKSELSLESIADIDFAFGRVVYLDQMEPTTFEWEPFFGSTTTESFLADLNRFRKNRSFDGERLSLMRAAENRESSETNETEGKHTIQLFDHGLALRSQSRLVYAVDQKYSRFITFAGIDPKVRPQGHVEVVVLGDGRELFRKAISGEDIHSTEIDVPIQGVQRLTIEVRYGEGLDVADFVHLGRARVIK